MSSLSNRWLHQGKPFRLARGTGSARMLTEEGGLPDKPAPAPRAAVTRPHYAPPKGVRLGGQFYQGGEELPAAEWSKLSETARKGLLSAGSHTDPGKADQHLLLHPAPKKEELEAGHEIPEFGRRERPSYPGEPAPAKPPKQVEKSNTPSKLHLPPSLREFIEPEEEAVLIRQTAVNLVKTLNQLPPDFEYVTAARMGEAQRGWYRQAAHSFQQLFGDEAPRFVSLLSAFSPQIGVREDLWKTLEVWDRYQQWMKERKGKLPSPEEVKAKLAEWEAPEELGILRNGGKASEIPAAVRALSLPEDVLADPTNHPVLSEDPRAAPKINSFRLNLMGNLMPVTEDVWMAAFGEIPQKKVSKFAGAYLANNVKVRRAAEALNQQLREGEVSWTPAEVQETVWSTIRALAYVGGLFRTPSKKHGREARGITPLQALAELTHETVRGSTNMLLLMAKDTKINEAFKRLGLGKAVNRLVTNYRGQVEKQAQTLHGPVVESLPPGPARDAAARIARRASLYTPTFTGPQGLRKYAKAGDSVTAAPAAPPPAAAPPTPPTGAAAPQQPAVTGPQPAQQPQAQIAVSPQTQAGLSFEDALQKYRSSNQAAFRKLTDHIRKSLGLEGTSYDAVGDWQNEAENSVLQQIKPESAHPDKVKYAAAWYGLLGNQKSVLYFLPGRNGADSVYTADIPQTDVSQVRAALDKAGIKDRTIIPTSKGAKVVFYDEGRRLRDQFLTFASGYPNARVSETTGAGSFIGAATRSAARRKFRSVIDAYERTHGRPAGAPGGPPAAAGGSPNPAAGQAVRLHRRGLAVTGTRKGRKRRLARVGRAEALKAVDEAIFRGIWHTFEPVLSGGNMNTTIREWIRDVARLRRITPTGQAPAENPFQTLYSQVVNTYPGITRPLMLSRLKNMLRHPQEYDYLFTEGEARKQGQLMKLENSGDWRATQGRLVSLIENAPSPEVAALAHNVLTGGIANLSILADALEEADPTGESRTPMALRLLTDRHLRTATSFSQYPTDFPFDPKPDPQDTTRRKTAERPAVTKPQTPPAPAKPKRPAPGEEGYAAPGYTRKLDELARKPVRMSAVKAPAQGLVVRGVYYKGGKFIPTAELEKARYDQHQQVEAARKQQYRRADGSYDLGADLAARRRGRKKK